MEDMMRRKLEDAAMAMIREDIHATAVRNDNDGWWAGQVECRCDEKTCVIVKSAYIFEKDTEALQYAVEVKRNMRREFIDFIRDKHDQR